MGVSVRTFTRSDSAAWNDYVAAHKSSTVCHLADWSHIISDTLGHRPIYVLAEREGTVCGVLPLFLVTTWWRKRFLVSIPWLDYGGPLADDSETERALVVAAVDAGKSHHVDYVELRSEEAEAKESDLRTDKVTFRMDLSRGRDEVWKGFDAKLRNQIRKSEKCGLETRVGGTELLDRFYTVFSRNMRDLGTPVWGRNLFTTILERLPENARLISVEDSGDTVAAALELRFKGTRYVPSASSYREARTMCPNHALYWRLIRDGCDEGARLFDFGRSTWDGPTFRFKKQWTPDPIQLHWQYCLGETPDPESTNSQFDMLIKLWQKLPIGLANFLGPRVIKNFP